KKKKKIKKKKKKKKGGRENGQNFPDTQINEKKAFISFIVIVVSLSCYSPQTQTHKHKKKKKKPFNMGQMSPHASTSGNGRQLYYEHNMKIYMNSSQLNDRLNVLLKLLSTNHDFEVRYHIIQLLTSLLLFRGHVIRSAVINIYGAINTLTELFCASASLTTSSKQQSAEAHANNVYIRNAMLILLTELCRNDSSIQKLFFIMNEEITDTISKEKQYHHGRDKDIHKIRSTHRSDDNEERNDNGQEHDNDNDNNNNNNNNNNNDNDDDEQWMIAILDALKLLHALLEGNGSNITYFVEIKCVETWLVPLWKTCLTHRWNDGHSDPELRDGWLAVAYAFLDVLMCVINGMGHSLQLQNALGVAIDPLLLILGDFTVPADISLEGTGLDESLLLKHKCFVALRCLLHGHTANQNRLLATKVQILEYGPSNESDRKKRNTTMSNKGDWTVTKQSQFAVVFFLKMSLGMIGPTHHPLLSILSGAILYSFFFKNYKIANH
ncbi:hypothetical protein RFI_11793, partial [Reticulomyxa filosa]